MAFIKVSWPLEAQNRDSREKVMVCSNTRRVESTKESGEMITVMATVTKCLPVATLSKATTWKVEPREKVFTRGKVARCMMESG